MCNSSCLFVGYINTNDWWLIYRILYSDNSTDLKAWSSIGFHKSWIEYSYHSSIIRTQKSEMLHRTFAPLQLNFHTTVGKFGHISLNSCTEFSHHCNLIFIPGTRKIQTQQSEISCRIFTPLPLNIQTIASLNFQNNFFRVSLWIFRPHFQTKC